MEGDGVLVGNTNDFLTRRGLLGRALGTAALVSSFEPEAPLQAQAAAAPPRIRDSFDFDWKFLKADAAGAQQPAFADAAWRSLDLPHDWSIEGPFAQNEPSGGPGGNAPTGIGWYRKHFRVPAAYRNRKVALEFDGVYQNSEVWLNGHYLGKRPFGYISFAYDATPYLNPAGENVVAVRVDNSRQPGSRWYSGSGIYRHTWLTAVNPVHVAQWGTFVTTPRIGRDRGHGAGQDEGQKRSARRGLLHAGERRGGSGWQGGPDRRSLPGNRRRTAITSLCSSSKSQIRRSGAWPRPPSISSAARCAWGSA